MRQTEESPDDSAFRKVLENLRYKACTEEDILWLKSRIAGSENRLNIDDGKWRYAAIITARNLQKDLYNERNGSRFAGEVGQGLHSFYSVDTKGGSVGKSSRMNGGINHVLQKILWNQRPSTSEQIPPCLRLCIGMPVMIRNNEATDLCITRGQEATVVGWKACNIKGNPGFHALDTLFVRLENPPRPVKLQHLPLNVVPLTKNSQSIEARLPNGDNIKITRKQVPVMPNFAMTDYASQGKTRTVNIVDLNDCKNHQAVYTCLSRGKSATDTLIVRDFPAKHLTGGLDGWLRQEFRDLNYLDKITELRFNGDLPEFIMKPTRWPLIDAFKSWATTLSTDDWHPALLENASKDEYSRPQGAVKFLTKLLNNATSGKRQRAKQEDDPSRRSKRRKEGGIAMPSSETHLPVGPIWDGEDHSCAFDSWLFILYNVWASDRFRWSSELPQMSRPLRFLTSAFNQLHHPSSREIPNSTLTQVRNAWREMMREVSPATFPIGTARVDICGLSRILFGTPWRNTSTHGQCGQCGLTERLSGIRGVSSWFEAHEDEISIQSEITRRESPYKECEECQSPMLYTETVGSYFCVQVVNRPNIVINTEVLVARGERYRICGVIYFGSRHFVSRVVLPNGEIYFHDGTAGPASQHLGSISGISHSNWWMSCDVGRASMVWYRRLD
jgi:hypothetical protein